MSEPVPTKAAAIYVNERFIAVQTHSGYRGTRADPDGKLVLLAADAGAETMGEALVDALSASRMIGLDEIDTFFDLDRTMRDYDRWVDMLMSRFGYGSKRALFKNMEHCTVESINGMIMISPTRHEKLEGWGGLGEATEVHIPESAGMREIGEAAILALSRCR